MYLKTNAISSTAYRSMILDRGVFEIVENKNNKRIETNVKNKSNISKSSIKDLPSTNKGGRDVQQRSETSDRKTKPIWSIREVYRDTSDSYQRPYINMELRSRINSTSGGSLPKQTHRLSVEEIHAEDSNSVTSYLTASRSIRKCCLTVFAACAKLASRSIGFFKNCSQRPYSCKPIVLSVKELSKPTSAGTDTLGQKNDPSVQNRITKQVKDLFKKPNSYKLFKNEEDVLDERLGLMYTLPELIYHRFQATYDSVRDACYEKSRIVWCVPYTIVALENVFFGNILTSVKEQMLSSSTCIYPIGLTNYLTGVKTVGTLRSQFRLIENKDYKIYSLDFKKFDSSIPNWVKDLFFSICEQILELDSNQSKVYNYLRIYVKHTPFVRGEGISYKQRGISSGLLITNLFDTWWNLTIHYFVKIIKLYYPQQCNDIIAEKFTFDKMYFDANLVKDDFLTDQPWVRVMGDDSIFLSDEYTLLLFQQVCRTLGMTVTVKHVTNNPDDDIFFLGRYWDKFNRPFQTEAYMALRICYTKWYNKDDVPFSIGELHLNRMLSICLPLRGGKEFLDKYLYEYEPYKNFRNSKKGFVYMKDFIENNFKYIPYEKALNVDSY